MNVLLLLILSQWNTFIHPQGVKRGILTTIQIWRIKEQWRNKNNWTEWWWERFSLLAVGGWGKNFLQKLTPVLGPKWQTWLKTFQGFCLMMTLLCYLLFSLSYFIIWNDRTSSDHFITMKYFIHPQGVKRGILIMITIQIWRRNEQRTKNKRNERW